MPIFEYRCKKCGEVFELLVRADEKPQCPHCKSKRLQKLLSTFNAGASGGSRSALKHRSGECDGGHCCGGGGHCCCGGHCNH